MLRWLAPLLPAVAQHWVLYDRDPDLLRCATAQPVTARAPVAPDGGLPAPRPPVAQPTVATRQRDITRLDPADLAGASLITASALLDMLTAEELERFVTSCAGAGCPVLVTLSVVGRVEFTPAEPLDHEVEEAFNEHQRRTTGGRRLLGPDAVGVAVDRFVRLGGRVLVRPSPWRLGTAEAVVAAEWFTGWLDAACEQRPELTGLTAGYRDRRLAQARSGRLGVTVHHDDLLVLPR